MDKKEYDPKLLTELRSLVLETSARRITEKEAVERLAKIIAEAK